MKEWHQLILMVLVSICPYLDFLDEIKSNLHALDLR